MKKLMMLISSLLISVVGFADFQDGVYLAEGSSVQSWTPFVKIVVKNSKIIGVSYDRKNNEGILYSVDGEDLEFKKESKNISRDLLKLNDPSKIDKTQYNSSIYSEFTAISNFLIEKMNKGESGEFSM